MLFSRRPLYNSILQPVAETWAPLEHGADINTRSPDGEVPLHLTSSNDENDDVLLDMLTMINRLWLRCDRTKQTRIYPLALPDIPVGRTDDSRRHTPAARAWCEHRCKG
jgi:hypothetical protein